MQTFQPVGKYLESLEVYNPVENAYLIGQTSGGGGLFEIDKVSRQDKLVTIDFHYYDNVTEENLKKVTLVVDEGQQDFKYLSCQVTPVLPSFWCLIKIFYQNMLHKPLLVVLYHSKKHSSDTVIYKIIYIYAIREVRLC